MGIKRRKKVGSKEKRTSIKSVRTTKKVIRKEHVMEIERVQEIASLSNLNGTIPIEFIRSENEQPATTTIHGVVLEVPVIDLSDPDPQKLLASIFEASKDWGIFQVVNHDIPSEVISKLQKVGKEFFELPQEEKEAIAKPVGYKGVEGYGTKLQKEVEGKKGWVDHLFHRVWPPSAINYQFWPKNPPSYRETNEQYTQILIGVANKLLGFLSKGLGLEDGELKQGLGGEDLIYMLKINYYPPYVHVLSLLLGWYPILICPPSPYLSQMKFKVYKSLEMAIGMMLHTSLMLSLFTLVTNLRY